MSNFTCGEGMCRILGLKGGRSMTQRPATYICSLLALPTKPVALTSHLHDTLSHIPAALLSPMHAPASPAHLPYCPHPSPP